MYWIFGNSDWSFGLNMEKYGEMRENADQNNSEYGHSFCSGSGVILGQILKLPEKSISKDFPHIFNEIPFPDKLK